MQRHRNNSAWLAVSAALDYLDKLDAAAMRAHNDALARAAGELLREAWDSEIAAAPRFSAAMASVRLPGSEGADRAAARRMAYHLTEAHGITAGVIALDDSLWLHVSAQIYNQLGDYRRLAAIGPRLGREIAL